MSTDDQIRDAFHSALSPQLVGLTVDPAMLSAVRRRHQRQQRMLAVGAPLGVAVITTGAVVGATAVHSSSVAGKITPSSHGGSRSSNQVATVVPMQAVPLVDHTLSVPADWTLSGNRKLIDLDTMQPPQTVGGKDQSVTATSPDHSQRVLATVYKGPIADGEQRTIVGPHDTMTTIDGKQVAIHYYGSPGQTPSCIGVSEPAAGQHGGDSKPGYTTVPCPPLDQRPQADVGVEYPDGDFAIIDTIGLTEPQLRDFLEAALDESG